MLIILCLIGGLPLFAMTDVKRAVVEIYSAPGFERVPGEMAAALLKDLTPEQIADGVVDHSNDCTPVPEKVDACFRLLDQLKPFPFHFLVQRYGRAENSREKAFLLCTLDAHASSKEEKEVVVSFAKGALSDVGPAFRCWEYEGEGMNPPAPEGVPLCVRAYSILIERLELSPQFPEIADQSVWRYEAWQSKVCLLAKHLGVRAPEKDAVNRFVTAMQADAEVRERERKLRSEGHFVIAMTPLRWVALGLTLGIGVVALGVVRRRNQRSTP